MRKNKVDDFNRGTKKRFVSVLPMLGAGLLSAGAITGVGLSVWHVARTYKESAEFTSTVNARVLIDPLANETDASKKKDKDLATANTKLAAEGLSAWLKYSGQESYDVSYQVTDDLITPPEGGVQQYYAYLTAKFNINKVASKFTTEKDEKIDDDPYLSIFASKGFNTNNKTFVYRWYVDGEEAKPVFSIKKQTDLFELPSSMKDDKSDTKIMNDKDSASGIVYKVKDTNFFNELYKNVLTYDKLDASKKKAEKEPRLYIVNNFEGMINEASYHLANYVANHDTADYLALYKGTDYEKFGLEYSTLQTSGEKRGTPVKVLEEADQVLSKESTKSIACLDVFNRIDKTPGTVQYSTIFSKYIEDAITYTNLKDTKKFIRDNIDDDKIKNELAKSETEDSKINWFWHGYASKDSARTYLSNILDRSWKNSTIVKLVLDQTNPYTSFIADYKTTKMAPKFIDTIFGSGNLVGILSLGFLIFLVILGIILGCLYRTTGIFSWICMIFALSMTWLISLLGAGFTISMASIFGMFIMSIITFITAIGICGKIKRRLLSNEDTRTIISKGFKKSIWPSADASIIALIFGICFTYIAPLGLNPLGLALIVGAFANFISVFLFNGLLHALWFNNNITLGHYGWFGKRSNIATSMLSQSSLMVPSTFDATKLEFGHYSSFSKRKFGIINKKAIVGLSILGALLIAGIVVFCILGIARPTMFHSTNCLVISTTSSTSGIDVVSAVKAAGINFTSFVKSNDGSYFYFYCSNIPTDALTALKAQFGSQYVWAQSLIGSTSRDLLTDALFSILIASTIVSVYVGIRCNWTAFVPMIVASFGLPILTLGIASIAQVKFDETLVLGYIMTSVITEVLCAFVLGSINATWSRKEGYSKEELKFIVNTTLKNDSFILLMILAANALFIGMFAVTAPIGTTFITYILIIGAVVACVFGPFVMGWMLYQFLIIRNKALIRHNNKLANKKSINYDEIDEQGIEGLNKFSKVRPVPKQDEVKDEQK